MDITGQSLFHKTLHLRLRQISNSTYTSPYLLSARFHNIQYLQFDLDSPSDEDIEKVYRRMPIQYCILEAALPIASDIKLRIFKQQSKYATVLTENIPSYILGSLHTGCRYRALCDFAISSFYGRVYHVSVLPIRGLTIILPMIDLLNVIKSGFRQCIDKITHLKNRKRPRVGCGLLCIKEAYVQKRTTSD